MPRYLLAVDGGGIRGILPAAMLVKLERDLGKSARDVFSFAGGTSTGSVIAAAVAAGVPAAKMLDLYLRRGHEVFPQRLPRLNLFRRIVLGYMYSTANLRRVLAEESGEAANWRINDSPIDMLITAKRVDDGLPWYFVKDSPRNSHRTGDLNLIDCVTASAAAPTYFKTWTVPDPHPPAGERPVGALTDGGVGVAGNPVYQACVEAFLYTDGYDPTDTVVISLGTGRFSKLSHPSWIWPWLRWILSEVLESAGEQQTELVQRHYGNTVFHRIDPDLKAIDPSLTGPIGSDAVGEIDRLKRIGEAFAATLDWAAILDGRETRFLVTPGNTLPHQYQRAVPIS